MFDWFWEFLYGLSKSIFRLIDGVMSVSNKLCGIEPITIDGKKTSFMNFLISNDKITNTFKVAAILGIVLLMAFGTAAMIRAMISEKGGMTPVQVFVKVGKTLLMFIFVPLCMGVFIWAVNIFADALYKGIFQGAHATLGSFMCGAFSQDALLPGVSPDFYLSSSFDYTNTDAMWTYIDLSDFDFFFSWVAGFFVLMELAKAVLMFVERSISIVVLFICSPFSMAASVIDDGQHFKQWREQVLIKFLTGYGVIIGISIYTLVVGIITPNSVQFFDDSSFLNNLAKLGFIVGGAFSLDKISAVVGNLVSAGAGTSEVQSNAHAAGKMGRFAAGVAGAGMGLLKAPRALYNLNRDRKQYGLGSSIASRLGFKTDKDFKGPGYAAPNSVEGKKAAQERQEQEQAKQARKAQERTSLAQQIGSQVAQALQGGSNNNNNNDNSKQNSNPVTNAIQNSVSNQNK